MAESVSEERARPVTPPRQRSLVYGRRFMLAYMLLIVVFGGAVAFFTYLVAKPEETRWGNFTPQGDGLAKARSIATGVSQNYVLGDEPLALVNAQPPIVENVPVEAVAIARPITREVGGGYSSIEPADSTLFYVFCGMGDACTMPGAPSEERGRLLRRQSLELALYTFKYMKDIDSVVTLLPPRGRESPAVYLRRRALSKQLDKPLRETLPGAPPFSTFNLPATETVERLTAHRWYPYSFQQLPNGRAILLLGRPPEPEQQEQQQATP